MHFSQIHRYWCPSHQQKCFWLDMKLIQHIMTQAEYWCISQALPEVHHAAVWLSHTQWCLILMLSEDKPIVSDLLEITNIHRYARLIGYVASILEPSKWKTGKYSKRSDLTSCQMCKPRGASWCICKILQSTLISIIISLHYSWYNSVMLLPAVTVVSQIHWVIFRSRHISGRKHRIKYCLCFIMKWTHSILRSFSSFSNN